MASNASSADTATFGAPSSEEQFSGAKIAAPASSYTAVSGSSDEGVGGGTVVITTRHARTPPPRSESKTPTRSSSTPRTTKSTRPHSVSPVGIKKLHDKTNAATAPGSRPSSQPQLGPLTLMVPTTPNLYIDKAVEAQSNGGVRKHPAGGAGDHMVRTSELGVRKHPEGSCPNQPGAEDQGGVRKQVAEVPSPTPGEIGEVMGRKFRIQTDPRRGG